MPTIKSTGHRSQFDPRFLRDCKAALDLCHNLFSFRCSEHILPFLLLGEEIKPSLRNVRIFAAEITPDPAQSLMQMEHLETLCLDNGSWAVMDLLPKWSALLGKTLTTLTISVRASISFLRSPIYSQCRILQNSTKRSLNPQ